MVLHKGTIRQLRSRADINVTDLLNVSNGSKYDVVYDTRELRFPRSGTDFPFTFGRERGWSAPFELPLRVPETITITIYNRKTSIIETFTPHHTTERSMALWPVNISGQKKKNTK